MNLSIVIPYYNISNLLSNCLNSILTINYNSFEIILVNDGSSDSSELYVKDLVKGSQRVKLINLQENMGCAYARRIGVNNAKGDYILFLDIDDQIFSEKIIQMLNYAIDSNLEFVYGDFIINKMNTINFFRHTRFKSINSNKILIELLKGNFPATLWAKLFKRDILLNLDFGRYIIAEDIYLLTQLLLIKNLKIGYFENPVYVYIINLNSLSRKISNIKIISGNNSITSCLDLILKSTTNKILRNNVSIYYFSHIIHLIKLGYNVNLSESYINRFNEKYSLLQLLFLSKFKTSILFMKFIFKKNND